tara:strand:+ start:576 stop:1106 length:531 start_codon:yes stop_codon:yes gene_type:complete
MVNSWSLLFDELSMTNQDYWEDDGFSIVGSPGTPSSDTIIFGSSSADIINFGAAQDTLSLYGASSSDTISFDVNIPETKNNSKYKYTEDEILKELQDYIVGTYNQHYSAGDDKIQTLDLIEACGDGEAFCRSNILKYASRYDKKGTARRDIMKILHYAVLLMHFNDKNAKRETYPQ